MFSFNFFNVQLRQLIHELNLRSGMDVIYQNKKHPISVQSMKNFLHMARDHLSDTSLVNCPRLIYDVDEIIDIYITGIHKFQDLLKKEGLNDQSSRFRWGGFESESRSDQFEIVE